MADFKEAGEGSNRLVVKTVAYYLTTTFIACLIGLAYALLILIPNMPDGLTYDDVEMEPTNTKDVVEQIEGIIQGPPLIRRADHQGWQIDHLGSQLFQLPAPFPL